MAGRSKAGPAARRSLTLALMLVGVLALLASGAPGAVAGPAEEEYKLQIPDPRGGESSSPGGTRSLLGGGSPGSAVGGTTGPSPAIGSTGSGFSGFDGFDGFERSANGASQDTDEALLAKARQGVPNGSGVVTAATSALGKTPLGLALLAGVLLITLAGLAAARRRARATGLD